MEKEKSCRLARMMRGESGEIKKRVSSLGFGENGASQTLSGTGCPAAGHVQVPCAIPLGGGGGRVE